MTTGSPPSITAMQELVVRRSIPKILGIRSNISRSHWTEHSNLSLPRYQSFDVGMTRTEILLVSEEMTSAFATFRFGSSSIPRNPNPSQIRARTVGAFSPMPPANTSVSSPPNAAANAPAFSFSRADRDPRQCAPRWRARTGRFGEFRSENRLIGCRWGSGRLTVEVGWPDQERSPEVFRSSLICSQSESYKYVSVVPELTYRPLKKLAYLFGLPLAS